MFLFRTDCSITHVLLLLYWSIISVLSHYQELQCHVYLTAHAGNTVQNMLQRPSRVDIFRVRYCQRARSITHLLHARLGYQHFSSIFCSTYSGSKSCPYCVVLDRLSGQYREIWTGLGCWGLTSCMTTVTCRVIKHYKLQEGCMNDPKESTIPTEI